MSLLRMLFLMFLNVSIDSGLVVIGLLIIRPVTNRILPARYRPWLWVPVAWSLLYQNIRAVGVKFSFLSLVGAPRRSEAAFATEYFPKTLADGGTIQSIVLPGGINVYGGDVQSWYAFTDKLVQWATIIWLIGMAFFIALAVYQSMRLCAITENAVRMDYDQSVKLLKRVDYFDNPDNYRYYLCADMPTSFVYSGWVEQRIYIQSELTEEQRELVLFHEFNHISMRHTYFKVLFLMVCTLCWYNPLIWLACHFYCKDMEYACDEKTIRHLPKEKRELYIQTLLDAASAKPMPGAPTSFGETDAAGRIKAAIRYKDRHWPYLICSWLLTVALMVFFTLGASASDKYGVAEAAETYPRFVQQQNGFADLKEYFPEKFTTDIASAQYSELVEDSNGIGRFWLRAVRHDGESYEILYAFYSGEWKAWPVDRNSQKSENNNVNRWNQIPIAEEYY